MVKVFFGKKGMGKTKVIVDEANNLASKGNGDVVFIDHNNQLMYDLKHQIRFIDISEFPISGADSFLGFICGIIAEDYDIEGIFIDGITYIVKENEGLEKLFAEIKSISSKFNIQFFITMTGDPETIPEYIKEFVA